MTIEPDIELVLVCASGFGNTEYADSDIRRIYRELRIGYGGPTAEILYRPWKARWKHVARRLHQVSVPTAATVFVGHSWGCGEGYRQFEREWHKCGREIGLAVLIDPVPRPFRVLIMLNWWALTRWGHFRVRHARHVLTYRQVNVTPMGRRIVDGDAMQVDRRVYGSEKKILKYAARSHESERRYDPHMTHETIDAAPEIREELLAAINSYVLAHRGE